MPVRTISKSVGPVEKVQFSLADTFAKPGEFEDSIPSDWCFSTDPWDFGKNGKECGKELASGHAGRYIS
jgi:hypothetical protein